MGLNNELWPLHRAPAIMGWLMGDPCHMVCWEMPWMAQMAQSVPALSSTLPQ